MWERVASNMAREVGKILERLSAESERVVEWDTDIECLLAADDLQDLQIPEECLKHVEKVKVEKVFTSNGKEMVVLFAQHGVSWVDMSMEEFGDYLIGPATPAIIAKFEATLAAKRKKEEEKTKAAELETRKAELLKASGLDFESWNKKRNELIAELYKKHGLA